jgi:superfamily I DNA and RNA helicase
VALQRTPKSSPAWLEKHSTLEDLISFEVFDSEESQSARLIEGILENLSTDELLPDDIIVINPDPLTTKEAVGSVRRKLMLQGVNSNLAGVTNSADSFSEPGNVTFTGIFRAKGNEAAMVYIINAQDCFSAYLPRDLARVRNRLFTAITRSKAWVRILGIGPKMANLKEEFELTKKSGFELAFLYPTEAERKEITIVNRDMSKAEKDRLNQKQQSLIDLLNSLESGETFIEDYPEDDLKKLEAFLNRKRK